MAYRSPLATTTNAGSIIVGSGMKISPSGALSTGGGAAAASTIQSVVEGDGAVIINGMTLTPGAGTYRVLFNLNYILDTVAGDITAAGAADMVRLYNTLIALAATGTHGAAFGLGETITPGVYDVTGGAASIDGILTLDAGGNPNALFVFRVPAALSTVDGSQVLLINSGNATNVFWVTEDAVSLGAGSLFEGTVLANNAAAGAGNGAVVNGRLLSTNGAITTDNNTLSKPDNPSVIPVRSLAGFGLFTTSGNVTNIPGGVYIGDIGTNAGIISGYGVPTLVVGGIYPPGSIGPSTTAFSFAAYANGVLVPLSVRNISSISAIGDRVTYLQTTATVAAGQAIDIRVTVTFGRLTINNRDLTIFLA